MSTRCRTTSTSTRFGLFPLRVTGARRLSRHYVRISLAGESLYRAAEGISNGEGLTLDAYIKLFIPPAGQRKPFDRELTENWYRSYMAESPEQRGWVRTYTVRDSRLVPGAGLPPVPGSFRPGPGGETALPGPVTEAGLVPEIDIDFVIHGGPGGQEGPGSAWAEAAREGDLVSLLAPLRGSSLWSSWDPHNAQRIILLADETAVPAALSIARTLTPHTRADLLLEVPADDDVLAHTQGAPLLLDYPQIKLHWLPRTDGHTTVAHGERLEHGLRQLLGLPQPQGATAVEPVAADEIVWGLADRQHELYVFIAGESGTIKTLRRICVNEAGIDRGNISFMGYWKKGRAEN